MIRVIFATTLAVMAMQECVSSHPEKLAAEEIVAYTNLRLGAEAVKESCDTLSLYSQTMALARDANEVTQLTDTSVNPTIVSSGKLIAKVAQQLSDRYENDNQVAGPECTQRLNDIDTMIGQMMYIIADNKKLSDLSVTQMIFWKKMAREAEGR